MSSTRVLKRTREVVLKHGPVSTEDLIEWHFQDLTKEKLEDLLDDCWYVTKDDSERWHLTNHATDRDKLEYYPPDVEPLPDYAEFFSDLAGLIEEYEVDEEERYRFLCGCVEFGESWQSEPGGW